LTVVFLSTNADSKRFSRRCAVISSTQEESTEDREILEVRWEFLRYSLTPCYFQMSGQYASIDLEKTNTSIRQNIIMILPEKLGQGTIDVLRKPSNHKRFRLLASVSVPLLVTGGIVDNLLSSGTSFVALKFPTLARSGNIWLIYRYLCYDFRQL